jgi:hypothetical protein
MHRGYKNSSSPHLDRTIQKVASLGTKFCKNYGAIRSCEKPGFNGGRTVHRSLLLEMILDRLERVLLLYRVVLLDRTVLFDTYWTGHCYLT